MPLRGKWVDGHKGFLWGEPDCLGTEAEECPGWVCFVVLLGEVAESDLSRGREDLSLMKEGGWFGLQARDSLSMVPGLGFSAAVAVSGNPGRSVKKLYKSSIRRICPRYKIIFNLHISYLI